MKLKPRFSLAFILLFCAGVACAIAAVAWLRTNTIILSEISGTLIARNGERYPTNRWFHQALFDPSIFQDDSFPLSSAANSQPASDGMRQFSVLETNQGKFRANVEIWKYEGSGNDMFRVELKATLSEKVE